MVANTSAASSETGSGVRRPNASSRHATMAQAVINPRDNMTTGVRLSLICTAIIKDCTMTPPPPTKMRQATKVFVDNSGLLVLGTLIALVWANLDHDSYVALAHDLHFPVNDVGMAFFFALATKEVVEATAPGGPLHSPRRAALPLAAAVGGMLGPALIFVALTIVFDRPNLERGWAIPCATDIAFSYLAARIVFGAKHPAIPFLLLLAIADDALGLLIIAAFYPTGPLRLIDFACSWAAECCSPGGCNTRRKRSFWPYIHGAGALSWIGFYRGGLHPALALVPIIPFVPHAARDRGCSSNRRRA